MTLPSRGGAPRGNTRHSPAKLGERGQRFRDAVSDGLVRRFHTERHDAAPVPAGRPLLGGWKAMLALTSVVLPGPLGRQIAGMVAGALERTEARHSSGGGDRRT